MLYTLYAYHLNINKKDKQWINRDRFVMSAGHGSALLYSTIFMAGIDYTIDDLKSFRKLGSMLQGHPDMKGVPGVDMSTGSLGQGLSAANGMALASKLDSKGYRVYALLGDGEIQEGQIWEAAMTSCHYKLDNLCVIVDNNNLQIDGTVDNVMNVYPIDEKFRSFGFEVFTVDGNNIDELITIFEKAKTVKGKPTAIVAKTIKGKGVSYMENQAGWHGKVPKEDEYKTAMEDLNKLV